VRPIRFDDENIYVAKELDAAISIAGFSPAERVVLREIWIQIYADDGVSSASVDPRDIDAKLGFRQGTAGIAIARLIKFGVIGRTESGRYTFIENFQSWNAKGVPLIPSRLLGFVLAQPTDA